MGVTVRLKNGKYYIFVNHGGKRKARCIGTDKKTAYAVKRIIEAKIALGDLGFFGADEPKAPTFGDYADTWLKEYAEIECKKSTSEGYKSVIEQYLRPRFGKKLLTDVKRADVKAMINELVAKDLSRNTVRNAICVIRGVFNHAIEAELLESNPAARLGRFTRVAKGTETKGIALTEVEVQLFLDAAQEVCPEYYPLFLLALRAGLRRGELVAVRWGDLQFGKDENDSNRFITVQHNFVHREHTTTKSKKSRRVDMSRDLRKALIALRDEALLKAFLAGKNDISDELVFTSPEGNILDPDNLYTRYFQPVLTKAGIRKIRLHDLRHTFGSLLIQKGASITYVKEQMGHHSISVTVDVYGHLIPGAQVSFVDRLDEKVEMPEKKAEAQPNATPVQPEEKSEPEEIAETRINTGGGEWTRTTDLRIMRPSL